MKKLKKIKNSKKENLGKNSKRELIIWTDKFINKYKKALKSLSKK